MILYGHTLYTTNEICALSILMLALLASRNPRPTHFARDV